MQRLGEKNMNSTTSKTVISAMLAALVFVLTRVVSIPSFTAVGNINLGDCAVLLTAWLLPCQYAFLAAGLGSALSDLLSEYAVYAPATFLIKGLMSAVACIIFAKLRTKNILRCITSGIVAEIIMILGYFAFESIFICGEKTALLNIPFNAVQGMAGLICGALLYSAIYKKVR